MTKHDTNVLITNLLTNPVDIARIALRRLTELKTPPTPENYVREYRRVAGLPVDDVALLRLWAAGEDTVGMVRAIIQVVAEASAGLSSGVEEFDADATRALANMDQIQNPDDFGEMLRTITGSAMSLKQVIDATRHELKETRQQLDKISNELEHSQALARTDPLTGFGNRRAMTELITREIARSRRTKEPFSLAILDIDHFKKVNDEHGHGVGDQALVHVAKLAKSSIRETDELCRYGGEEFVVTLPGATSEGAHFVIDRMRGLMERTPLALKKGELVLRYSAGVAELKRDEDAEALLKRADQALYAAKAAGRNRVMVATP